MTSIKFSREEKTQIVQKVKVYFREELDYDIGGFDAEFLIDFFAQEVGAYFYNRGLYDAQAVLSEKLEDITDALLQLEQPVNVLEK